MATLSALQTGSSSKPETRSIIHLWHLTSLDAPTVAIVWTLAFAWAADQQLPARIPLVVGLCAWTCYILDRILDAHSSNGPLRPRHHFHHRHRRIFIPLAICAIIAALLLVLIFMPVAARVRNTSLAVAAVAYFATVHFPARRIRIRFRFPTMPKELFVAVIFTIACATPTLARATPPNRLLLVPVTLTFIALAWLNCRAIEVWESRSRTLVAVQGLALTTIAAVAALLIARSGHPRAGLLMAAAALSAALLALLDRWQTKLAPTTLRAAADLVLLTPLLLIPFALNRLL